MPAPLDLVTHRMSLRMSLRWSLRPMLHAIVVAAAVVVMAPQARAQTLTTDEAVAQARQQVPGKLVAVTKEQQGDQEVYRVRILGTDGVVRTVFVNANR